MPTPYSPYCSVTPSSDSSTSCSVIPIDSSNVLRSSSSSIDSCWALNLLRRSKSAWKYPFDLIALNARFSGPNSPLVSSPACRYRLIIDKTSLTLSKSFVFKPSIQSSSNLSNFASADISSKFALFLVGIRVNSSLYKLYSPKLVCACAVSCTYNSTGISLIVIS